MNKTAIKNFAIWARNKLISDISYKAGLLGITEKGIKSPLPQSTQTVQFFNIGTKEPSSITGIEIQQRKKLVEEIERKAKQSDYTTAYKNVIEEVAYTWFNRLIAVRFMEVNDYLPTRIRVLSSESNGKAEPDLVTHALEANLDYSAYERDRVVQLKHENKLDELFRILFIKQCNALNANLPELFEKTSDYTELLLNVSFTDKEGLVYHLVNDISDDDFNVSQEGQVEIIGWLYQYYNTEPKDETFTLLKKNVKISRERIPSATQLFTPDWIVRYLVENSLGRLWQESHPNKELRELWDYYIYKAEESPDRVSSLHFSQNDKVIKSAEEIKFIDPCMGSGHILVYAFDVLMQIYTSEGYSERDAAKLILEKNLYGLEIDRRAYQLAYFALMMKARQYNRRILTLGVRPQVFEPTGYPDGMEYGSLIRVDMIEPIPEQPKEQQITLFDDSYDLKLNTWNYRRLLAQKHDVVVTNPPYIGNKGLNAKLSDYLQKNYPDYKSDTFSAFIIRCSEMAKPTGYVGMFTPYVWMFIQSYEKLRNNLYKTKNITTLIQFEYSAFEEATVPVCSFVYQNRKTGEKGNYIRLVDYRGGMEIQRRKYLDAIANPHCGYFYTTISDNFEKIPGSPLAYWVGNYAIFDFEKLGNGYQSGGRNKTHNNDRYVRNWWEVHDRTRFAPYANGGEYRKWYGNHFDLVDWSESARSEYDSHGGLYNKQFWGKQGICWNLITSATNGFRIKLSEFHYSSASPTIISENYRSDLLRLGFLNTKLSAYLLNAYNPTLNTTVTDVMSLPFKVDGYEEEIVQTVEQNIALAREDWDSFETSWDFKYHPLIKSNHKIADEFTIWEKTAIARFETLKANEMKLNNIFINIYGLSDEVTPHLDDKDVTMRSADLARDIRSLISYAIGCMFGRYSLDFEGLIFVGGKWDTQKYNTYIPDKDNILPITDDEYFEDDIVGLFVDFLRKVYGVHYLEENLNFIANALGNSGNSSREIIRDYFVKDFYKDHCKVYQKRPIYWLFDSGKQNGFKSLIYMHRYDENTIGNLRIDYLHRLQRIYENEIARMQDTIENSRDAREVTAATKRKEKLIKQLQETKEYDEKIAHLALARTSIDLDDGVKVNYEKIQTDRDGKKLDVLAKI